MVRGEAGRGRGAVRRGSGKKLRAALRWRLNGQKQGDWLAKLAEKFPGQIAEADVPVPPADAAWQPWHDLYWRAWEALRFDRQYGAMGGETPISFIAIDAYASRHGIEGEDFSIFRALLSAIDAEWLTFVAEKAEADRKRDQKR